MTSSSGRSIAFAVSLALAFAPTEVHAKEHRGVLQKASQEAQRRILAREMQRVVAAIDALPVLTRGGLERVLGIALRWVDDNEWEGDVESAGFSFLSFRHSRPGADPHYAILVLTVCPGVDLRVRHFDENLIGTRNEPGIPHGGARPPWSRVTEVRDQKRYFEFADRSDRLLRVVFNRSGVRPATDTGAAGVR